MFDLKSYMAKVRNLVDHQISACITEHHGRTRIIDAMQYSLTAGGKRVRPVLCIASTEAVNGDIDLALPVAVAIEMIHTYSLIHDDLPAMDDDALRRGAPTSHIQFDEATAILAGDALLTCAFEILSNAGIEFKDRIGNKMFEVIRKLASASGYKGMIEGQMRDMESEGNQLSLKEIEALHGLKTGKIIAASCYTGALIGNGSPDQIAGLSNYGRDIGLAFQVADDILNVKGDPAVMGKAVGTDSIREKNTYPNLIGLKASEALAKKLCKNAINELDIFGESAQPLRAIAHYIIERNR